MNETQRSPIQTSNVNPKIKQFLDEISDFQKEIFARYHLELFPMLSIRPDGIKAILGVREIMPVKKELKKVVKKGRK